MKVAFATYDVANDVGGVSTWLQLLLPRLQALGIEVEVHVLAIGGQRAVNCARFAELKIPFRWAPWVMHTPYAVSACLRMIAAGQPDIYVPNCVLPAYYAAGHARLQGIPSVGVLHSDDPFYHALTDEFAVHGSADFRLSAMVTVSVLLTAAADLARTNGVEVSRIGYGVTMPPTIAQPARSVFRLVYAGRLVETQKRISDVARALIAAARESPQVEAWIVGEGDARGEVERLIAESGLPADRVRLLGRVPNEQMPRVFADCHAFVLLSDYEGLPVALLEAMAAGVVPVCLDLRSGIREAITPGENGFIVCDRGGDFLAAIRRLREDAALWARLSAAARETVREHFSIETCAQEWQRLLRQLAPTAPRAPFRAPWLATVPPYNPKFGPYDPRDPWAGARMTVLGWRRRAGAMARRLIEAARFPKAA